jgi:hypothetical protein
MANSKVISLVAQWIDSKISARTTLLSHMMMIEVFSWKYRQKILSTLMNLNTITFSFVLLFNMCIYVLAYKVVTYP